MNGYAVESWGSVAACVGVFGATCAVGLALSRQARRAWGRAVSWALLPVAIGTVGLVSAREPVGVRMLLLIGATWCAMKTIVTVESAAQRGLVLSTGRWWAFFLWGGMRVRTFTGRRRERTEVSLYLRQGAVHAVLGGALLVGAARVESTLPATLLALVGLSFLIHFGLFRISTAVFRSAGFDCRPLFRAPALSTSLREFWGRRWNLGFTQMIQESFYGAAAARRGATWAAYLGFLFSGLLHEVAISLPARQGFGGPLAYFLLHGALVVGERAAARRGWEIERTRVLGRAWTLAALVLPLPLLFHEPFLDGAIRPLFPG